MATLKDVARLACVDVSTVSRALNNTSYVHPDTKAKIYQAVKELSYQPNLLAKGLRQGKRHTIGIVIPSISLTVFAEVTQYIEAEARKLGYGVMICNTKDDPDTEAECLSRLRNGLVDGVIIAGTGKNNRLIRDIKGSGISVVQLIRKQDNSVHSVVADYYTCAYEGVHYLAEKQCRKIGMINGSVDIIPYRERFRGYCAAIQELGLETLISESAVPRGNYFDDGYQGADSLLKKTLDLDGILVAVDMQGIGVIRLLKEKGIAVPDEIKLVSLTGHSIGGLLQTSMTSMEIPSKKIGEKTAQMLISEIESKEEQPEIQHEIFQSSLIERESS